MEAKTRITDALMRQHLAVHAVELMIVSTRDTTTYRQSSLQLCSDVKENAVSSTPDVGMGLLSPARNVTTETDALEMDAV